MYARFVRLSDEAIEAYLATNARLLAERPGDGQLEHERQQLLNIRLDRDIEMFLIKRSPERAAELRTSFEQVIASPEHRQWERDWGQPAPIVREQPRVSGTPLGRITGRCEAFTIMGRRCFRGVAAEGLCMQHLAMKYARSCEGTKCAT